MPWLTKRIEGAGQKEDLSNLMDGAVMVVGTQTSSGFPIANFQKTDLSGDGTPSGTVPTDDIVNNVANQFTGQGISVAVRAHPYLILFSTIVGQDFDIAVLYSDDDEVDPIG